VHDTDTLGAGCVLCHQTDFLRGAFGERTILLCDTCEREYHVGCLASAGMATLSEVKGGGEEGGRLDDPGWRGCMVGMVSKGGARLGVEGKGGGLRW
jgi:hypothetical protein